MLVFLTLDGRRFYCGCHLPSPYGQEKNSGTKTELKNLNSFKRRKGLEYEVQRQAEILRQWSTVRKYAVTMSEYSNHPMRVKKALVTTATPNDLTL